MYANEVKVNNYVSRKLAKSEVFLSMFFLCNNIKTRSNQSLLNVFELMLTKGREMQIDA